MRKQKFWVLFTVFLMTLNSFIPVISYAESANQTNETTTVNSEVPNNELDLADTSETLASSNVNEENSTEPSEESSPSSIEEEKETPESTDTASTFKQNDLLKAEQTANIITDAVLTDTKGDEFNTTTNRPQRQAPLKLTLQVGTTNQTIQAGTYEYQLPTDIAISNNISGRLENAGNWTLDKTGKLTIVFNENVVNGTYQIEIETSFIPYDNASDLLKTIVFPLANDQEKVYDILFKLSGEATINLTNNKKFNTDNVAAEIRTNINRETIQPNEKIAIKSYIVKNNSGTLEDAAAYVTVKNIKVFTQDVSMGGQLIGEPVLLSPADYTLTQNNTTLDITLNSATNKAVIVTYENEINEESITNEALYYMRSDANIFGTSLSNYAYFQYNHNPHLTKKGEYNAKTNTITWTVDYNMDSTELKPGTKLTDILTDEVASDLTFANLKIYTLYVYGTNSISLGGYAPSTDWDTSDFGNYSADFIYTNTNPTTQSTAYRFIYETAVSNPSLREIQNEVSDSSSSADAKVNLAPSNISKTLEEDSLDMTSGTVDWTIVINSKHWGMQFNKISDTFGERVKELVDGSIDFYYYEKGDDETKHSMVAGTDYTLEKTESGFTVNMLGEHGNATTNKYIFTYTSKFDNSDIKAGDELTNKVALYGNGTIPMEASASFNIPNYLVSGGQKNVAYDSTAGIFTWTVGINEERHKYKNLVFDDEIESIQKLDKDSIEILELDKMVQNQDKTDIIIGEVIQPGDARYPTKIEITDNKIHLEFSEIGNKKVVVRYKTEPTVGPTLAYYTTFTNIAKISDEGSYAHDLKAEALISLGLNTYKGGRISALDNKLAAWTVRTNIMPENRPYKDLILEDSFTLSDKTKAENTNFVIGTEAFVVKDLVTNQVLTLGEDYEITFNYDENASPAGSAIKNYENNYFKITFKHETRGVSVEYQTATTKSANVYNTAVFTSNNISKSDWMTVNHTVTSGSGSGQGVGQIPLQKIDQDTKQPLQGAIFELFDAVSKNTLGLRVTSDEDGKAVFKSIAEGNYLIKEVTAPEGYKIAEDYQEGVVLPTKSDDQVDDPSYVTVVENEHIPTTGTIELRKVDSNGEALSGAEFTLSRIKEDRTEYFLTNTATSEWVADKDEATKFVSNDQGLISISDLEEGTYKFTEVKAPKGYDLDSDPVTLELTKAKIESRNTEIAEKVNLLSTGTLRVKKVDQETKVALSGAEFTLISKADPTKQQVITADEHGIAEFSNLDQASYTLVETKAPLGYLAKEISEEITIEPERLSQEITVENQALIGEVAITHSDTDGNKISEDYQLAGKVGTKQTIQPRDIDGYSFKEIQKQTPRARSAIESLTNINEVIFTEESQKVVLVYEKTATQPVKKEVPKTNTGSKQQATATVNKTNDKNKLPNTNEKLELWQQQLGYTLILILASYFIIYYSRKKYFGKD